MTLVRLTEHPGKGCGKILNEDSISNRAMCGMESIHGTDSHPKYYLCPECYLRSLYSEDTGQVA